MGNVLKALIGFGGYWLFRYSGVPFETMVSALIAITIAMLIGAPIGLVVGHVMSSDGDVDTTICRLIAWGNLVAWIIPAVGLCLSFITWQFQRRSETSSGIYKVLYNVGGLLSMASAGVGAALVSGPAA